MNLPRGPQRIVGKGIFIHSWVCCISHAKVRYHNKKCCQVTNRQQVDGARLISYIAYCYERNNAKIAGKAA